MGIGIGDLERELDLNFVVLINIIRLVGEVYKGINFIWIERRVFN